MFPSSENAALDVSKRGWRTDNGTPEEKLDGLISAILSDSPCTNFRERIGEMVRDPRITDEQFRVLAIVWTQQDLTLVEALRKRRQWVQW